MNRELKQCLELESSSANPCERCSRHAHRPRGRVGLSPASSLGLGSGFQLVRSGELDEEEELYSSVCLKAEETRRFSAFSTAIILRIFTETALERIVERQTNVALQLSMLRLTQ